MASSELQNLFRVALDLPLKQTFTYAAPKEFNGQIKPGHRVLVSFRNRRATGYVLQNDSAEPKGEIKEIIAILDQEPLFPPGLIPFFKWLADYYLYPIGRLIQSALPGGLNEKSYPVGLITSNGLEAIKSGRISSQEHHYLEWVKQHQSKRLPPPLETAYRCQKKGWIQIESRTTKRKTGPLKKKVVQVLDQKVLKAVLKDQPDSLRAKNEIPFLEAIYQHHKQPLNEISSLFSNGNSAAERDFFPFFKR
jgi:primosomal protein N' (replication factor Y)